MSLLLITGCSIGIKEKVTIVYASFSKDPQIKGAVKIATNKPIPVTVDGKLAQFNAGGYYLVHERDLQAFLNAIKKAK
jgi:hypothetical protein